MNRPFIKNCVFLLGILFGYAAEYLFNIILARHMSPQNYGELSLILRLIGLGVPIFLMGFDNAIYRFLPPLLSRSNKKDTENLLSWLSYRILVNAVWLYFILSILVISTHLLGIHTIKPYH